jgi:hypothetical protein
MRAPFLWSTDGSYCLPADECRRYRPGPARVRLQGCACKGAQDDVTARQNGPRAPAAPLLLRLSLAPRSGRVSAASRSSGSIVTTCPDAGPNARQTDRGRHAAIGQQPQVPDRLLGRFHDICPGRLRNVAVVCAPSPQVGAFRLGFRFTPGCNRSAALGST